MQNNCKKHLLLFLIVNIALFAVDFYDINGEPHDQWWFYWTTGFWGMGLLAHVGMDSFGKKSSKY
ncbi:MAG: 2TM domain-containing protein [Candidatus Peregrinibacteria bacterium]|nr:2TM domain-containing protein [Candidatus Peregrinibacteria bacterium]